MTDIKNNEIIEVDADTADEERTENEMLIDSVWFSNIKENEKVEVEFSSAGCFHHHIDFYEFTGIPENKVEVTFFKGKRWPEEGNQQNLEKMGQLKLKKEELKQLDKLIMFYQSEPEGGCTTIEHIKLKLIRKGKVVVEKEYRDASCATYRMEDLMTFGYLKLRIEENNK